jgi:Na+/proline symporter
MCTYGFAFVPANLLFMALGVLLVILFRQQGLELPVKGDDLLPMYIERAGTSLTVLFTIGIVAASFSSADSALTAMTTSYCVDIKGKPADERLRKRVHIGMAVVFAVLILMVDAVNSTSVIDAIYILCSYTYGPLLGLFAYALLTRRSVRGSFVPYFCVASPLVCFALDKTVSAATGYSFGYELLMLNGLLTFVGLWISGEKPLN